MGPATVGGAISAHGLGGAKDLPIPSELAIAGAVAALVVSFTVLAVAWREPRYDPATSGRPAPAWLDRLVSSRALAVAARVLGTGPVSVDITLLTPEGQVFGEPTTTEVRSAAYARAAQWVVGGLFGILVVLLGVNFVRRRRPGAEGGVPATDVAGSSTGGGDPGTEADRG